MIKLVIVSMSVMISAVFPLSAEIISESKLNIITSIVPQEYFVERIGGERVTVEAIVQPGQSPHTYEPTPRQMTALSNADIFFRVGATFENVAVPKIQDIVSGLTIIDTRDGISFRTMESHSHDHGHHGCCPHHETGSPDPHIWLSPKLVARQALTIRNALTEADPEGSELYESNYQNFIEDLNKLDTEINELLANLRHRTFMVYHPAWGYFADEYKLTQLAIETDGKSPPARQLARTIDTAKEHDIKVIFVQPQFSSKTAETVADAIGGTVVSVDPLARDFFDNMRQTAQAIARGSVVD